MRVYVARHGETTWNLAGRYQGRRESALTALGMSQAFALAGAIVQARVERVVSSPLLRCTATAKVAADRLNVRVERDDRLIEIAHGASERVARTDTALTALAAAHFGHTTLTAQPGLVAKAIYSRDGSWCYVVASGAPRGAHVVFRTATGTEDLGALDDGTPATLFAQQPGRAEEVDIVTAGTVIAHGKPVY